MAGGVDGFDPEHLKIARLRAGLSSRQLSKEIGVAATTALYYEHGTARPRPSQLKRLAEVLDVPVTYLAPLPLAPTLRDLRDREGLSIHDIAATLGIGYDVVWRMEHGLRWPENERQWAAAYHLTLREFAEAWRNSS